MSPSSEGVVTWAHRHRVLVFTATACLLALSFLGLRQVAFDANVLRLLPESGHAVPAFRTFLERFGTLDDLYVVFTAPDGYSVGDYEPEIEGWVAALRAVQELSRVDSGKIDASRDWSWLADRELLLFDDATLQTALDRMKPETMPATLAATRELLTIPSPDIAALVRDDPLGLHELLRQQLSSTQTTLFVGASTAGYVTADGRKRLVIARPLYPPYDAEFSHTLFDRLESVRRDLANIREADSEPQPPLAVEFAGGHRIAIEAEAVVKRESIVNGVGSLVLILPLLFLVFRSAWLVVIGAIPSAVALLVVLGFMGFAGVTLSAAATGASAMLFGLGVDGVVLLYVAHRHAMAEGRSGEDAIRAIAPPAASMMLGMWTTAATFLGLVVVDFPSLEQLGLLIGLSMVVCGVLTLLLVPASLPSRPPARALRSLTMPALAGAVRRWRSSILVGAAIVTLVLGYLATTLRVNPTLERLRSVTEGARLIEDITRDFGLPGDVYVVVAEGQDLQALLAANENLSARLRRENASLAFQAPSSFIPSDQTQLRRRQLIRERVPDAAAVTAALEHAAVTAGFRPQSFESFGSRLPRMTAADVQITWEGFNDHGLQEVTNRFVQRRDDRWLLATYVFPKTPAEIAALERAVAVAGDGMVLTGLPVVNAELGARFMPQFLRGLAAGSIVVIVLIYLTFRRVGLSLLTLVPTVIGLLWAGGLLAIAGFELDLFSVFAVITFVGIGVDYGVHLVHRYRELGDAARATSELAPVILVAGAITLLGYGTLIGSSYPPLRSIGVVSAVSVVTLVIASVFVLPALLQRDKP
jgi:predicted RND superfamily exporter protein